MSYYSVDQIRERLKNGRHIADEDVLFLLDSIASFIEERDGLKTTINARNTEITTWMKTAGNAEHQVMTLTKEVDGLKKSLMFCELKWKEANEKHNCAETQLAVNTSETKRLMDMETQVRSLIEERRGLKMRAERMEAALHDKRSIEAVDLALAKYGLVTIPESRERMKDAAEMLWIVLANVSGGDWTKQSQEWQEAAERWRDNYFAVFSSIEEEPSRGRPSHADGCACPLCIQYRESQRRKYDARANSRSGDGNR